MDAERTKGSTVHNSSAVTERAQGSPDVRHRKSVVAHCGSSSQDRLADYLGNGVGIAADPSLARGHVPVSRGTSCHAGAATLVAIPAIQTVSPAGETPITAGGLTCVN